MPAIIKKAAGRNIDERLETAIAEISRLAARYHEIEGELRRKADCTIFEERVQKAQQKYSTSQDPDDLATLIIAEFVLDGAREKLHGLYRAVYTGDAVSHQFITEFPDWRDKLIAACELRLQKARIELENITAAEREHLGGNYDEEDVSNCPPVRRAKNAVTRCERLLENVRTDVPEACWSQNAAKVLDGG